MQVSLHEHRISHQYKNTVNQQNTFSAFVILPIYVTFYFTRNETCIFGSPDVSTASRNILPSPVTKRQFIMGRFFTFVQPSLTNVLPFTATYALNCDSLASVLLTSLSSSAFDIADRDGGLYPTLQLITDANASLKY